MRERERERDVGYGYVKADSSICYFYTLSLISICKQYTSTNVRTEMPCCVIEQTTFFFPNYMALCDFDVLFEMETLQKEAHGPLFAQLSK